MTPTVYSVGVTPMAHSIAYGYNSRSEVTTAIATTRTAYDFAYSYDNIGNRATYAAQGQTPPTEYVMPTNGLNQYSGTTDPDEAFEYDFDGNLTIDGDFEYTWDAENRLTAVEATIVKVEFTYDYMSRRVRKVSYEWQSGNWVQQTDQKFVYDGWNPVLELASGVELPASTARTWGLDLSQTLQGAGGVGGLLATHLVAQVNAFVYDGNGNVSEALRASDGNVEAHYEYDPFGNTTASSGTWADANPFRFSTKWFDAETILYYYGLRYYSPRLGRWTSRDPIEERGGVNLQCLVNNQPVIGFDFLGLVSEASNLGLASPVNQEETILFAELAYRWSHGITVPVELPEWAVQLIAQRSTAQEWIKKVKQELSMLWYAARNKNAGTGWLCVKDKAQYDGGYSEAWYLGQHQSSIVGTLCACRWREGFYNIQFTVTDKWDFDENDKWPSGIKDIAKKEASIIVGMVVDTVFNPKLGMPSGAPAGSIPVHGVTVMHDEWF